METTSAAHKLNRWVLVQGPAWGDAEFLSKWLLAAAQAESFWRQAYEILDFAKQVEPVCICYIPDFGISAFILVMHLKEHRTSFLLNVDSEDGEPFAMMLAMGFFEPTPDGYRMALPTDLTAATVREARCPTALRARNPDNLVVKRFRLGCTTRLSFEVC